MQGSLGKLRTRLEDDKIDPDKRKELREDYDFQTNIREQLHRMRTWPYGLGANLKYLVILIANLFGTVEAVAEKASKWFRI